MVPLHPHVEVVEHVYNCNIYVINLNNIPILGSSISLLNSDCLMYKSENRNREHYFLLYDEEPQHYHCITDIKKCLGVKTNCYNCMKGFTSKTAFENHECGEGKKKKINYKTSDKLLKDLAHYLTPNFVKGSKEEIEDKCKTLKNEFKLKKAKEIISHPQYIIYDFETDTHTDVHKPNHVEVDILKIDNDITHEYEKCLVNKFGINGYDCCGEFCDWLFTPENANSTVIAHNGSGYDNKFILKYCLSKGITPQKLIRQGSRISYMTFAKYSIRFVDSYLFLSQPLKGLSKTYDIDTLKGYFPHHFNTPENQHYIGKISDIKHYGPTNMSIVLELYLMSLSLD